MLLNLFINHQTKLAKSCCSSVRNLTSTNFLNNSTLVVRSASTKQKSGLSTFSLNPNREYKSLRVLVRESHTQSTATTRNRKFLLVLGNSAKQTFTYSGTRKMSTTSVDLKLMKVYDNVIKSSQDNRLYRGLLLDNGLKCLVISDPTTDRSAASLDVHAGYMLDPPQFPGLAHFLEHMLFMGSKKVSTLEQNNNPFFENLFHMSKLLVSDREYIC
jgi:hypothetical protein